MADQVRHDGWRETYLYAAEGSAVITTTTSSRYMRQKVTRNQKLFTIFVTTFI
jgi:hypothetical protein